MSSAPSLGKINHDLRCLRRRQILEEQAARRKSKRTSISPATLKVPEGFQAYDMTPVVEGHYVQRSRARKAALTRLPGILFPRFALVALQRGLGLAKGPAPEGKTAQPSGKAA